MNGLLSMAAALALVAPAMAGDKAAKPAEAAKDIEVTGEVVDATCYLAHGASGPSHHQCATDCANKGLPLAIANEADGKAYFPTDGNKQLMAFISERVTVKGSTMHEAKALELKMPAMGGRNEIELKVSGGYEVITFSGAVAKAAPKAEAKTEGK